MVNEEGMVMSENYSKDLNIRPFIRIVVLNNAKNINL